MPYDPDFPPDHQPLNGAPFRDQFNALKAQIDTQAAQIADLQAQLAGKAANPAGVAPVSLPFHDPVQPADVQPIVDQFNALLAALQQP